MDSQKQFTGPEIQFLLSCSEADENEMINCEEFANRFQEPAREIGFNVAVLLTNLSEHVPHDPRLRTFLELAESILEYFRPYLGRIEIMGSSRRIERIYFEISETNRTQWEMPQVRGPACMPACLPGLWACSLHTWTPRGAVHALHDLLCRPWWTLALLMQAHAHPFAHILWALLCPCTSVLPCPPLAAGHTHGCTPLIHAAAPVCPHCDCSHTIPTTCILTLGAHIVLMQPSTYLHILEPTWLYTPCLPSQQNPGVPTLCTLTIGAQGSGGEAGMLAQPSAVIACAPGPSIQCLIHLFWAYM